MIFRRSTKTSETGNAGALLADLAGRSAFVPSASRPHVDRSISTPTRKFPRALCRALLLVVLGVLLSQTGCTTRNYYIYQLGYGENRIDAEVLKEESITPTLKASLK
jgi:hypothetical protein